MVWCNRLLVVTFVLSCAAWSEGQDELDIKKLWKESPFSTVQIKIKDRNRDKIKIKIDGENLIGLEGAKLVRLDGDRYDMVCDLGTFRLQVFGDLSDEIKKIMPSDKSVFELVRDSFELTGESEPSRLWLIRGLMIPRGCDTRFDWFTTDTKSGFVSGVLRNSGKEKRTSLVMLYDKTGTYQVNILPQKPKVEKWEELIQRISITVVQAKDDNIFCPAPPPY